MADTYSIGSLSDLITGSNTPNKPKVVEKKFKVTPGKVEQQNEQNVEKSPEKSPKILKANNTPNKFIGKKNKRKSVENSSLTPLKKQKTTDTSLNESNDSINESVDKKKAKKRKSLKQNSTPCKENAEVIPVKKVKNDEHSDDQSKDQYVMKTENVSDSDNQSEDGDAIQQNEAENDSDDKPELRTEFQKNAERRIKNKEEQHVEDPEQTARTVYVGNVPLLAKKNELKKFFSKYGTVEAVRFRGIAAEDPKISKRIAFIKQKFHKDRKSCAAYVRFVNEESAQKALRANGTVFKEHHLTVDISKAEKKPDESRAIFIGNISFSAEEEDLWKLFETCGPIESVRLIRDKGTGIGKGFGYVNFKTSDAVQLALEMGEITYKDRVLRISLCNLNAAKKNKKRNKVKKINKPGKPKAKLFKKDKKGNVVPTNDDTTAKEKREVVAPFQGSKVTQKKKINKPGKPKVKLFKKDRKGNVVPTNDDTTAKEKREVIAPFQGSKVTQKKRKNKPHKGLLAKKKLMRKLAPHI